MFQCQNIGHEDIFQAISQHFESKIFVSFRRYEMVKAQFPPFEFEGSQCTDDVDDIFTVDPDGIYISLYHLTFLKNLVFMHAIGVDQAANILKINTV